MRSLAVFVLLFISLSAHSKNISSIVTQVNFGDKISNFRVYEKGGKQFFAVKDTYGKTSEGLLTAKSYDFIVKKTNEVLRLESNDTNFCVRKYISVKAVVNGKSVERKGCIGSSSATAVKMTELTNTLQLLR